MSIYDVCHEAGGMSKYEWERDPKRLGFILARYKFVAKMFAGMHGVIEIGCSDGFGTRVVRQEVSGIKAFDIDAKAIEEAKKNDWTARPSWFVNADFLADDVCPEHDAAEGIYCLDVIEHIERIQMHAFLSKLRNLAPVCIIGTPSLESQQYASALSKKGHVNCMTGEQLRGACLGMWKQAFIFGMNDETLHTGFLPMSHYLFALCVR